MANKNVTVHWTTRDDDIAAALFRCVRTTEQLRSASAAFSSQPFRSLRRVQARLRDLQRIGWVAQRRYRRSIEEGNSYYYQLTLAGFRQWRRDPAARPPTKRFFAAAAEPRHHHLYDLARFWTAIELFAAASGYTVGAVQPEGAFSLTDGRDVIEHDGLLPLVTAGGRVFWVFLELDRSTESLTSTRDDLRHWQKILRVYDHVQNHLPPGERFRVWAVCTQSRRRAANIAELFHTIATRPNRQLLLSFALDEFETSPNGLLWPLAYDHRHDQQTLLPRGGQGFVRERPTKLVDLLAGCR